MVSAWFWVGSAMPINWDISIQIPAGTQMLSSHKVSGLTLAPAVPSPPQLYHLTHPGENCSDFSLSRHNKTHLFSHSTIPTFFSLSLWAVPTSSNMSPSQLASFFVFKVAFMPPTNQAALCHWFTALLIWDAFLAQSRTHMTITINPPAA